jgi:hypothetical protein
MIIVPCSIGESVTMLTETEPSPLIFPLGGDATKDRRSGGLGGGLFGGPSLKRFRKK